MSWSGRSCVTALWPCVILNPLIEERNHECDGQFLQAAGTDHEGTQGPLHADQSEIWLELELAGIEPMESDFNDDDGARYYTFKTREQAELFLSLVECDPHPSGYEWKIEDEQETNIAMSAAGEEPWSSNPGFTVCFPRVDLHIVHRNLKRLNSLVVPDCDERREQVRDRRHREFREMLGLSE